jgi:hypothetical protein
MIPLGGKGQEQEPTGEVVFREIRNIIGSIIAGPKTGRIAFNN